MDLMAASSSSSSSEQQYSLRWNDFHSSILNSFRHLKDQEDFVDVTLACDQITFTAHKVVLSACSPYFRKLLKDNPCPHPIVILRDVAPSEMESLLRFMYHGEVHVGQEQLAAFLKTAQMLQVRGLADVNSGAATAKVPPVSSSHERNGSAPATPGDWLDNHKEGYSERSVSPPPQKRPRSYSPLRNHAEPKTDLQESLLGQALEGGPTIHTTPSNNIQAQSTGDDSNSVSENEEEISNNDSILNSVKTEPSDVIPESIELRNTFPSALLQGNLQGLMAAGPSGIHAANQEPNYGRWQPSGGDGSSSSSGWLPGTSSTRNEHAGSGTYQSGVHNSKGQGMSSLLQQHHHHQHLHATSQASQQHALNALNSLNTEQLTMMHQKLQNNLQSLQQQQQQTTSMKNELNLMLQSCSKDKIQESMALFQQQRRFHQQSHHQMDSLNQSGKPKCPECGKIYSNNSNLKQHIVNVHTVQTEYVSCHVCSKQFKTKQYLQIHLLSMHGIRKRKSYPLYQMQMQQQSSTGPQVSGGGQQSQQQYPAPERWSEEK